MLIRIMKYPKAPDLRSKTPFNSIRINLFMNGQDVGSLTMPGMDPRFMKDQDAVTQKILDYVNLRQEHSRRASDNQIPDWDSFTAEAGLAHYSYSKPTA